MNEIALLIFLGIIFFFLYRKDRQDRDDTKNTIDLFNQTVKNVLDQVESNTEKFYEMTTKMQIKHFENLEKHTGKLLKILEQKPATIVKEMVRPLSDIDSNEISNAELREDPFSEDNRIPMVPGLKIQFDGEEEIHPVNIL